MDGTAASSDDAIGRIHAASSRMLAGAVDKRTLERIRGRMAGSPEGYPWEAVVDEVLAGTPEDEGLVQRTLRAQRDWVLRGQRTRRSIRRRGKTFAAYAASRLVFFVLYTLAVIALLLVLKHRWPDVDVYAALDWLRARGLLGGG